MRHSSERRWQQRYLAAVEYTLTTVAETAVWLRHRTGPRPDAPHPSWSDHG
jgi:hypothetical protein